MSQRDRWWPVSSIRTAVWRVKVRLRSARWVMVRRSTVWVCIGCTCHQVVRRWDWMPDMVTSAPSSMTEAWRVGVRMPKARSATTARPMRSPLRSSYHRARRSSGSVWPRPIPVHGTPPARHGAGAGTTTVSSGTGTPIVRINSRPPRCSHIRAPRASAPLGASSTCRPVPSRCVPCTPMAWSRAGGCGPTIPSAMAYLGTPMDMIGSVHRAPRSSVIMVGWSPVRPGSFRRTHRSIGPCDPWDGAHRPEHRQPPRFDGLRPSHGGVAL